MNVATVLERLRKLQAELLRLGTDNELRTLATNVDDALAQTSAEAIASRVRLFWTPWYLDKGETFEMAEGHWEIKEPDRGRILELMDEVIDAATASGARPPRWADPVLVSFSFDGHQVRAMRDGALEIDGAWRVGGLDVVGLMPPTFSERAVDGVLLVESIGGWLWAVDLGRARYAFVAKLHPGAWALGHRFLPRARIDDGRVRYRLAEYEPPPVVVLKQRDVVVPLEGLSWQPGGPI